MKPCKTIVDWSDIQSQVRDLNVDLWRIIDSIPEAKNLPLSIVSYPYGDTICDDKYYFDIEGNEFDKKPAEDFPIFLLLKGKLELYLNTPSKMIPQRIYSPGELFPYNTQIDSSLITPSPLNCFTLHSGVRNLIVMSLWSNTDTYRDLKKKFNISNALSPSNPSHHYSIAKQMLAKEQISWESKLLCFNEKWMDRYKDKS